MVSVIEFPADLNVMQPLGILAVGEPIDQAVLEQAKLFDVEEGLVDVLDARIAGRIPTEGPPGRVLVAAVGAEGVADAVLEDVVRGVGAGVGVADSAGTGREL
ncbi:MAG: hypothetical protein VXW79_07605, partial [Bacteroidota bacterium]|nr:hypothetical protein [Bacteroidota bacterium]